MPHYDFAVTDNLSPFLMYNEERIYTPWLQKIVANTREMRGVRLWSYVKRYHSDALYAFLESLADGIVELDYRESAGVSRA